MDRTQACGACDRGSIRLEGVDMITLNTPTKLPISLKWYVLAKLAIIFFVIPLPFMLLGNNAALSAIFFSFVVFIVLLIWLYTIVSYRFVSFAVGENMITINSGIFVKHSSAISFGQIQNVTSTRGPLAVLFGFSKLNIWTASPSQIHVQSGNSADTSTGLLWLKTVDAEWLKNFILAKRS